jgi:nicotinamidase-related amidase
MLLNRADSAVLLIDVQEKLTPHVLHSAQLLERCAWVLRLAKVLDLPIVVSEQYPKGLGPTCADLTGFYEPYGCISKIHFSCMQEPNYQACLNQLNKNQLVLIGIEAHVCVLQTALQMKEAGYSVYVVVDAVSSRSELDLKYGLKRMKQEGIHLVTSEMLFFEWLRQANTEAFRSLSKTFLERKHGVE